MQVTETLVEGLKHEFQISVPASDLDAKADARLVDLKDKVRLNGFRPGKVPVSHLKKVYGRSVMAETIDQTIRDTNTQIFTERGFRLAIRTQDHHADGGKSRRGHPHRKIRSHLHGFDRGGAGDCSSPISRALPSRSRSPRSRDADVDEAIKRIADQNRSLCGKGRGRQGRKRRSGHDLVQGHHRGCAVRRRHRREHPGHDRLQHLHSRLRGASCWASLPAKPAR